MFDSFVSLTLAGAIDFARVKIAKESFPNGGAGTGGIAGIQMLTQGVGKMRSW
jgi:hypothetical protein